MMRKQRWALVACLAMVIAACGGTGAGTITSGQGSPTTAAVTTAPTETTSGAEVVEIRWFVGLGAGGQPEQIDAQNAAVEQFNATHDDIELVIEIVQNDVAYDTLATQISSGNGPDIVGPVGIRGANAFNGRWLDLQPLVDATGYDLSRWDQAQVDFWRTDEGLVGLPFGSFPAMIFYNRDLFDEAGLPYPPHAFGEEYNGQPWTTDTLRELGLQLTVDASGNDATSADFDPNNIVQFGYAEQWSEPQRFATMFGAAPMVADDGSASIPDSWRTAFDWYYQGTWEDVFIPNAEYQGSELLAAGNPFDSGNLAMSHAHLWYTCCLTNAGGNWDIAVVPEHEGTTTAALHADVFRILNTTEHPAEAFEVLTYLVGEAAPELLAIYGAMPADLALQPEYFSGLDEANPQGVDWQVAIDSLGFPDVPSHEQDMPNFQKAFDRWNAFWTLIQSTPGLDIQAELDTLKSDLDTVFSETS
jgi:multiple sugar transport system substrate-binding protein